MFVKPEITIVIPCYNSGRFLIRSIESIIAQTFKNFELIIVNDGSTEKLTISLLKKYKNFKKIKIITQNNKGLSSARNLGIKKSKSPFILMLDADDWIDPETLEIFYKFLKKNKKYKYIYTNINLADEKKVF